MPLGTSTAMTGRFDALTVSIRRGKLALDRTGKPCAEQGVNHHIGPGEQAGAEGLSCPGIALGHGGGVRGQTRLIAVEAKSDFVPSLLEVARGDKTVAAVIPGTA